MFFAFAIATAEYGKRRYPKGTHFLPAVVVAYRVLQDTLEQHRKLRGWPTGILIRDFEHRVLDHIQRCLLVAHGKQCLLIGTAFDFSEEIREFLMGSQLDRLVIVDSSGCHF